MGEPASEQEDGNLPPQASDGQDKVPSQTDVGRTRTQEPVSTTTRRAAEKSGGGLVWPTVAAVAVLLIGGWFGWGFGAGQNSEWVSAWGLRLTLWGLVVSVAGFVFTIWQLLRTRSSAVAASNAVIQLREDFSSLDVMLEISAAMGAAKHALDSLSASEWRAALSNYNALRSCLDKSIAAETGLLPEELDALQSDQAHFLGASDALEAYIQGLGSPVRVDVLTSRLRRFESFSTQLQYKIRKRFGGKQ